MLTYYPGERAKFTIVLDIAGAGDEPDFVSGRYRDADGATGTIEMNKTETHTYYGELSIPLTTTAWGMWGAFIWWGDNYQGAEPATFYVAQPPA
jgi:hypothetical protein